MVGHRLAQASHVSPPNYFTPRPPAGSFFILSRLTCSSFAATARGNMSMLRFFTMLMVFLFSVPALAAERVALVVGNSSYEHVPALDNPINDAKLMAETL